LTAFKTRVILRRFNKINNLATYFMETVGPVGRQRTRMHLTLMSA